VAFIGIVRGGEGPGGDAFRRGAPEVDSCDFPAKNEVEEGQAGKPHGSSFLPMRERFQDLLDAKALEKKVQTEKTEKGTLYLRASGRVGPFSF